MTMIRADPAATFAAIPAGLAAQDVATDATFPLGLETYLAAARAEPLAVGVHDLYRGVRDELAEVLADAGLPDPRPRAALLAAALDGLVMHRAADPTFPIEDAARLLVDLLAGPLMTTNDREASR